MRKLQVGRQCMTNDWMARAAVLVIAGREGKGVSVSSSGWV